MCCTRLVFSTSKKMARRVVGSGRSGSGGRAAARPAGAAVSTGGRGSGSIGSGGGAVARGLRRGPPRPRLLVFLGWLVTSRPGYRARTQGNTDGQARQSACRMRAMTDPAVARDTAALFELIRPRYGERLRAEELGSVRRGVESIVQRARLLRAVRLDSADEPVQRFTPFRREA